MNLKASEEKFNEAFEKLKEATKCDWSYDEASLESVYPALEKSQQDGIGELFGK